MLTCKEANTRRRNSVVHCGSVPAVEYLSKSATSCLVKKGDHAQGKFGPGFLKQDPKGAKQIQADKEITKGEE